MTTENTNVSFESVPDTSEKKYTDGAEKKGGGRLFTQRELEKCIGERLIRERRNNASLENIKKLVDGLCERGILNADSYAEAERELCEKLCSMDAGNTREENSKESPLPDGKNDMAGTDDGNSGESVPDAALSDDGVIKDTEKDAERESITAEPEKYTGCESISAESEKDNGYESIALPQEKDASTQDPAFESVDACAPLEQSAVGKTQELYELCSKHPELDAASLLESDEFISYCTGRSGTLLELYEGFTSLLSAFESFNRSRLSGFSRNATDITHEASGNYRHAMKALSSTGFSRLSANESSDYSGLLSPSQRDIARRAGISYREYAQLLADIPDGSRIKKHQR